MIFLVPTSEGSLHYTVFCCIAFCRRVFRVRRADLTTTQRLRNGRADALCRRLGLRVTDMGVAQRHARPLVTEQAGDDRQRNALQDGVARERMTQVMQAHVFDPGSLTHRTPERQAGRKRPPWIERRGEDPGAPRSRLTLQDGASRCVQENPPRSGLGVAMSCQRMVTISPFRQPVSSKRRMISACRARDGCRLTQ